MEVLRRGRDVDKPSAPAASASGVGPAGADAAAPNAWPSVKPSLHRMRTDMFSLGRTANGGGRVDGERPRLRAGGGRFDRRRTVSGTFGDPNARVDGRWGFGDDVSRAMIACACTHLNGAVRHATESFNYYWPQELDDECVTAPSAKSQARKDKRTRRPLGTRAATLRPFGLPTL